MWPPGRLCPPACRSWGHGGSERQDQVAPPGAAAQPGPRERLRVQHRTVEGSGPGGRGGGHAGEDRVWPGARVGPGLAPRAPRASAGRSTAWATLTGGNVWAGGTCRRRAGARVTARTGGGPAPRIRDSREGPGALLLPLRARSCRLLCGSGVRARSGGGADGATVTRGVRKRQREPRPWRWAHGDGRGRWPCWPCVRSSPPLPPKAGAPFWAPDWPSPSFGPQQAK